MTIFTERFIIFLLVVFEFVSGIFKLDLKPKQKDEGKLNLWGKQGGAFLCLITAGSWAKGS